jgi:hypothetical protein
MAKRVRRTVRRPAARPGTRPSAAPRPQLASPIEELEPTSMRIRSGGLTAEEMARAAELEAEIVANERAAETAARRTKARTAREAIAYDPNVPLRVRASHEYAYVARDVRRIGLTAGLMVTILLGLHFAINVAEIIKL